MLRPHSIFPKLVGGTFRENDDLFPTRNPGEVISYFEIFHLDQRTVILFCCYRILQSEHTDRDKWSSRRVEMVRRFKVLKDRSPQTYLMGLHYVTFLQGKNLLHPKFTQHETSVVSCAGSCIYLSRYAGLLFICHLFSGSGGGPPWSLRRWFTCSNYRWCTSLFSGSHTCVVFLLVVTIPSSDRDDSVFCSL